MQNTDSPHIIQIPVAEVNIVDLIQQLSDENCQLRQIIEKQAKGIDEMANTLAIQKELIQQPNKEKLILVSVLVGSLLTTGNLLVKLRAAKDKR